MRTTRKFEVKTGKNRGTYIICTDEKEARKLLKRNGWGILVRDYNYDFYKRHQAQGEEVIITHSCYAPSLAKKWWEAQRIPVIV